jgi:hypothetical protein
LSSGDVPLPSDRDPAFPEELLAEAALHPNGWVYEVRPGVDAGGAVPPEAIKGGWAVGPDGVPTGEFVANPNYRPFTEGLLAAAAKKPNGWVYEVRPEVDASGVIPADAIKGAWAVGPDGMPTGRFVPNQNHRPERASARDEPDELAPTERHECGRFVVRDVLTPKGMGTCVAGYVQSGSVHAGDELTWSLGGVDRRDTCRSIMFITERPVRQPPTIGLAVVESSPEDFSAGTVIIASR